MNLGLLCWHFTGFLLRAASMQTNKSSGTIFCQRRQNQPQAQPQANLEKQRQDALTTVRP